MIKYVLLSLTTAFLNCSSDDMKNEIPSELKGEWIESDARMDTLTFQNLDGLPLMNLNRGKELINGNLLPKIYSGPYDYIITAEKIALRSMLSSNSTFTDYYFLVDDSTLSIGNFFDFKGDTIVTFEKLEQ